GVPPAVRQLHSVAGLAAAAVADDQVGLIGPGQVIDRGSLALVAKAQAHGDDGASHGGSRENPTRGRSLLPRVPKTPPGALFCPPSKARGGVFGTPGGRAASWSPK